MGLMAQIRPPVMAVLNQLLSDGQLSKTVTYRKFSGQAWSESKGVDAETFVESAIDAIELRHNQKSIAAASSSELEVGDYMYVFRADDLPEGYSMKDQIVVSGSVKRIKNIDNVFGMAVTMSVDGA